MKSQITVNELYSRYIIYKAACITFDRADAAWENNYENAKLEREWSKASKDLDTAQQKLIDGLVKFTGGLIAPSTARVMVLKDDAKIAAMLAALV